MLVWAPGDGISNRRVRRSAIPSLGWADFWDTAKFPGDRALVGSGSGNNPELEFALLAAGVPPDKLYPLDLDKAFASYDKIKPDVVKWWDTGAVPPQLLTDKEVVMSSVWNGRMATLQKAGVPAAISWPQGLSKRDCWAVPKGAKNRDNAMKFIAFSTMAIPQARLSSLIPYGFVNDQSVNYMTEEQMKVLPSAPAIRSQLVPYNYQWWVDNRDTVILGSTSGCWDERCGVVLLGCNCARISAVLVLCATFRWRSALVNSDLAGAQWIGQEHDLADHCRVRNTDQWGHRDRRQIGCRGVAAPAEHWHGVPELRSVPASDGRERRSIGFPLKQRGI